MIKVAAIVFVIFTCTLEHTLALDFPLDPSPVSDFQPDLDEVSDFFLFFKLMAY